MEIVITIALLIVPVISIAALFLTLRTMQRMKALKGLVIDLSKIVNEYGQEKNPVTKAMQNYTISGM